MYDARRAAARLAGLLPLAATSLLGACGPEGPSGPATPAGRPAARPAAARVAACDGPAFVLPAALAAALPPLPDAADPAPRATIDDRMAALSRRVPGGFAGVFYDGDQPVLLLTAPAQAAEAKRALAPALASFPVADAAVRQARWDYGPLYDWYRHLRGQGVAAGNHDVISTDLDESENRLHFGVPDAAARDRLAARLTALGVPCDLVLVSIEPIPVLL